MSEESSVSSMVGLMSFSSSRKLSLLILDVPANCTVPSAPFITLWLGLVGREMLNVGEGGTGGGGGEGGEAEETWRWREMEGTGERMGTLVTSPPLSLCDAESAELCMSLVLGS